MEIVKVIIAGLAIGILISAPMGPIGMLCIQRTLNKGRASGFFTGVGAAFSDLLYSLLTGFGLSFVINFIEKIRRCFRFSEVSYCLVLVCTLHGKILQK